MSKKARIWIGVWTATVVLAACAFMQPLGGEAVGSNDSLHKLTDSLERVADSLRAENARFRKAATQCIEVLEGISKSPFGCTEVKRFNQYRRRMGGV